MKKESKSKLRKIILLFAIAMMITSALMSYFFVRKNESIIDLLKIEMQTKQMLIRDIWANIGQMENKANNVAILISILAKEETTETKKLLNYYLSAFPDIKNNANIFNILEIIDQDKKANIENINNLYLEQSNIQATIIALERSNKFYSDLAFFLQILSLVMIIFIKDFPL